MIHVRVFIVLIEAVKVKFVFPKTHVIFFVLTNTNSQGETIYKSFYIIGVSLSTHPIVDRICTLKYYKILYTVNLFCKFSSMSGSCSLESGCFCQAFVCLWNIIHVRGINILTFFFRFRLRSFEYNENDYQIHYLIFQCDFKKKIYRKINSFALQ